MNSRYRRWGRSRAACVHGGHSGTRKIVSEESSGEKEAFTFASETTKQLIALTSAILALTITFAKDIFVTVPFWSKVFLVVAWFVYIFSLLFGIATLGALKIGRA